MRCCGCHASSFSDDALQRLESEIVGLSLVGWLAGFYSGCINGCREGLLSLKTGCTSGSNLTLCIGVFATIADVDVCEGEGQPS